MKEITNEVPDYLKIVDRYIQYFSKVVEPEKEISPEEKEKAREELFEFLRSKGVLYFYDTSICSDPYYDDDAIRFGYRLLKALLRELRLYRIRKSLGIKQDKEEEKIEKEISVRDLGREVICPKCGREGTVWLIRTCDKYNVNTYLAIDHYPSGKVCTIKRIHVCQREGAFGERPDNPLVRDLIVTVIDLLEKNRRLKLEVRTLRETLRKRR